MQGEKGGKGSSEIFEEKERIKDFRGRVLNTGLRGEMGLWYLLMGDFHHFCHSLGPVLSTESVPYQLSALDTVFYTLLLKQFICISHICLRINVDSRSS